MDLREAKALEIAARMRLNFDGAAWTVPSQTSSGSYRVVLSGSGNTCTCDDFALRGPAQDCKHILACRLVAEREGTGKAPALDTDTLPKKLTYRQNWPVYNLAQAQEKHRFQVLLHDLCRGVAEPAAPKCGQRPHSLKDALFAAAFKVYSTFSSRRFSSDLRDAYERGHLARPIPGLKVNSFLENAALTPLLHDLIVRSSLPLRTIDVDFAPDSSGFSTSRFVRWFDEKYGGQRREHDWVKAHIMTGVKTNVVTAVRIEGRDANDCPQFKPLLETTAQNFTVKEVSADKAYSSLENVEATAALGAFPAIAFKSNATGGVGGAFERLFYYYSFHREEFLKTYHKRSNVESTFSMVKAKFRDHVRSKTDVAMVNEVLCKFLCHNICVVIMSQCELGIEAVFWPEERKEGAGDEPRILPLLRNSVI